MISDFNQMIVLIEATRRTIAILKMIHRPIFSTYCPIRPIAKQTTIFRVIWACAIDQAIVKAIATILNQ
jgi:hypothetical protein